MSLHEIEKRKYGTEQAKTTPQKSSGRLVNWHFNDCFLCGCNLFSLNDA